MSNNVVKICSIIIIFWMNDCIVFWSDIVYRRNVCSILWTVFVASIATYHYCTVLLLTQRSLPVPMLEPLLFTDMMAINWLFGLLRPTVLFVIGCTTYDYYSFWMTVMAWNMSHKLNDWYTDKWLFSILKGHLFLTSLRICYSLGFSSLLIYIYVGVQALDCF